MACSRRGFTIAAAVAVTGLSVLAMSADGPPPTPGLDFLQPGKAYLIRFPEGSKLFSMTQSGVSQTTYVTEDGDELPGGPATWSATLTMKAFRVVRLSNSSWVLLEHARNIEDAADWAEQLHANRAVAGAPAQKPAAKSKIPTVQTWVNLNHAVAISDFPDKAADAPSHKNP